MDVAVLAGTLDVPEYDRRRREYIGCDWLPPKWDWVDPAKDARAEIEQIDAGLKSRFYAVVVLAMGTYSAIAGGVSLAILMLPTVVLTAEEALKMVPRKMKDAALGAGRAARRGRGPRRKR